MRSHLPCNVPGSNYPPLSSGRWGYRKLILSAHAIYLVILSTCHEDRSHSLDMAAPGTLSTTSWGRTTWAGWGEGGVEHLPFVAASSYWSPDGIKPTHSMVKSTPVKVVRKHKQDFRNDVSQLKLKQALTSVVTREFTPFCTVKKNIRMLPLKMSFSLNAVAFS